MVHPRPAHACPVVSTLQIARVQSTEQTKSSEKTLEAFLKYISATDHKINQTFEGGRLARSMTRPCMP